MKNILMIFLIALFAIVNTPVIAKETHASLDKIVAIVNDDAITASELRKASNLIKVQIQQQHIRMPAQKEFQKEVLNQLINKKLQLQFAKNAGINISDADVNNALKHVAELNHISVPELYKHLQHDGISSENYRREIREQLTLQRLQQQEVIRKMVVSSGEIDAYLKTHPTAKANGPKEYHVEDILVPLSDSPTEEEKATAKKIATNLIKQLNSEKKLADILAKENLAVQATDLGWRRLEGFPSIFVNYIATMQTNSISPPILAGNGVHILRVLNIHTLGGQKTSLNRREVEEILLQKKFEDALKNWQSKLRSQAYIKILI